MDVFTCFNLVFNTLKIFWSEILSLFHNLEASSLVIVLGLTTIFSAPIFVCLNKKIVGKFDKAVDFKSTKQHLFNWAIKNNNISIIKSIAYSKAIALNLFFALIIFSTFTFDYLPKYVTSGSLILDFLLTAIIFVVSDIRFTIIPIMFCLGLSLVPYFIDLEKLDNTFLLLNNIDVVSQSHIEAANNVFAIIFPPLMLLLLCILTAIFVMRLLAIFLADTTLKAIIFVTSE
jgi:hypothetical protein